MSERVNDAHVDILWVRWPNASPHAASPVSLWHAVAREWADDIGGRGVLCCLSVPDGEIEVVEPHGMPADGALCRNCMRTLNAPKLIRRRRLRGELPGRSR